MKPCLDFVVSGAGLSGVIISKYLRENGISFLTLEKRDGIGGIWNYTDDENITTCTTNTITTSGKRLTVFSDLPPHEEWSEFLHWSELLQHIHEYANHYDILGNIKLNSEILRVEKIGDGLWEVEYESKDEGRNTVHTRNFIVAGGAFSSRITPLADKFGETFVGDIYHAQQVKLNNTIKFRGKRVLITGGGETASDMAMHAACVADKACWAIPDGLHCIDRCAVFQNNADLSRPTEIVFDHGPSLKRNQTHTQHLSDKRHNNLHIIHKLFGANGHGVKEWAINNYYGQKFPIKNGEAVYLVHEGKIKPYRRVVDISGNCVTFDNEKSEDIDMIIECTGYEKSFNFFVDKKYQSVDYDKLFRSFIHIDDPSVWFIGLVRPMIGSVPGFVEYQSQYLVDLFKHSIELPSIDEMKQRIQEDKNYHLKLTEGCTRFRPDILDGFTYYPYVMSSDMGRFPGDHLDGLSEEGKEKVMNANYNAGLFLWVGDPRKKDDFIKSIEISQITKMLRARLHSESITGEKVVPRMLALDAKVFKKKNGANFLLYGKGEARRRYMFLKRFPILHKLISIRSGNCGPFPVNHPYFTYHGVGFHTTTPAEKGLWFAFFLALFLVLNLVANAGFNLNTYFCAPVALALMYLLKLSKRSQLLLLGGLQAAGCFFMNGMVPNFEMLFAPLFYPTLVHHIVKQLRTVPVLRDEVATMV